MQAKELYIGLMSGTSLDAVDAVLVDFGQKHPTLITSHQHPLPLPLKQKILALNSPGDNEIERAALLDRELGSIFSLAVSRLLTEAKIDACEIQAIGSHGQTIRHAPSASWPYTVQLGDPNTIAQTTNITTVADFRRRDIAAGGQGAPLVPLFHRHMFAHPHENRVIANIGGMANITLLCEMTKTNPSGFDTGPGNVLSDLWINHHKRTNYDADGQWARTGKLCKPLLDQLLAEPFFAQAPPKSTGRDLFSSQWLDIQLENYTKQYSQMLPPQDVQATLVELTALSLAQAINTYAPADAAVYLCGGGVHNQYLLERLQASLPSQTLATTSVLGVDPDNLEAMAFAWLAKRTVKGETGNEPQATGATMPVILGGVYFASR